MTRMLLRLLLALPILAGCTSDSDIRIFDPTREVRLRVMNATPDGPPVDVLFAGIRVVQALPYAGASTYLYLAAGAREFQAVPASGGAPVVDFTPDLVAGNYYTVVLAGLSGSVEPLVLTDERTPAPPGSFKLRAVHLAAGGPPMDVYFTSPTDDIATATPTFAGIAFEGTGGYATLPITPGRLRVTEAGTKNVLVDSNNLTPRDGQISTLFIVGQAGVGTQPYSGVFLGDIP
jgi:hypothetical protein